MRSIALLFLLLPALLHAQSIRVLTNQVGYESSTPKHAVVLAGTKLSLITFELVDDSTGSVSYHGRPVFSGTVDKWKQGQFWPIDFTPCAKAGVYRLRVKGTAAMSSIAAISEPFLIGRNVL